MKNIRHEIIKISEKEYEVIKELLLLAGTNNSKSKEEIKRFKIIDTLTDKWEKLGIKWEKVKEGQHRALINGAEHWLLSIEEPDVIMERNRSNGHSKNKDMTKLRDKILGSETISGGRKKGSVSTRIIREIFSEFS